MRHAWREIVSVDPLLVLVAAEADVPAALRLDDVRVFEPIDGVSTTLQAQCIRLFYPALLPNDGAVIVSDVDMAPLSDRYFHDAAAHVGRECFLAYRDVLLPLQEIPICYNAALPRTWGAIFNVESLDDVRACLRRSTEHVVYDGTHGGEGWITDQLLLYRTLLERGRRHRDVWILDDRFTRFRRLERTSVEKWAGPQSDVLAAVSAGRYSDFHCLRPDSESARALNECVVAAAHGEPANCGF